VRGPRHVIGAAIVIVAIGLGISGAATAADVTVTLTTSGPQPARLSVALGDTVTFVNSTPDARTLTSDDQSFTAATIPAGATYKWVAVDPGNISYRFGDGRTDRGAVTVERKGSVKLAAKPVLVTFGHTVTLSGLAVPTGFPVLIESRGPGGAAWQQLTTATPASEGAFTFDAKPVTGTQYRASLFDGILRSTRVTVNVRPNIRLASAAQKTKTDRTVKLRAYVAPRDAGTRITLSAYSPERKAWRRVSGQPLKDGRAVIPWKVTQGATRLRLSIDGRDLKQGLEGAVSNVIRITGVGAPAERVREPRNGNRANRDNRTTAGG